MEQYKKEFIDFMLESKVLKFGDFTLKSGRKSPFFMNAGAYGGEFRDIVVRTKCLDYYGNVHILKNEDQHFSYRHSIFSDEKLIILETELLLNITFIILVLSIPQWGIIYIFT